MHKTTEILHIQFFIVLEDCSCDIIFCPHLSEKEAKTLHKMMTFFEERILLKFQILKWKISKTCWDIKVRDGMLFCIFQALSYELNLNSDYNFPLIRISVTLEAYNQYILSVQGTQSFIQPVVHEP